MNRYLYRESSFTIFIKDKGKQVNVPSKIAIFRMLLHNVKQHSVDVTGRNVTNAAAHNLEFQNVKFSKYKHHITYRVTVPRRLIFTALQ